MDDSFGLHRQRRGLFSSDVAAYDSARPGYPERVYELLRETCGLGPGSAVLEIGPGTGQATGRLLDHGASVVAVELSPEFAALLETKYAERSFTVAVGPFEDVALDPASFDLVVAATSFHWVDVDTGIRRAAEHLRPGGHLALWWALWGDPDRDDPFSDALGSMLREQAPQLVAVHAGLAVYLADLRARRCMQTLSCRAPASTSPWCGQTE